MPGSFSNVQRMNIGSNQGSFSNVPGSQQGRLQTSTPQSQSSTAWKFEGNPIENIGKDLATIGADITTLVGGIFGYDKEAQKGLYDLAETIVRNPVEGGQQILDSMLSTYNLATDDFGKMPLGEMIGNVAAGVWKRPVTAFLDFSSIYGLGKKAIPKNLKNKIPKLAEQEARIKLGEEVLNDNLNISRTGREFVKQINNIEKAYTPETIARAMEAVETVGFNNIDRLTPDVQSAMRDLSRANDTYKQFTSMVGAEIFDDFDFAALELIAKEKRIPFQALNTPEFRKTKTYQDALKYVKDNDVRPLFHLKPNVYANADNIAGAKVETDLLKRGYGSIDYTTAPKKFTNKANQFVDKVMQTYVADAPKNLNKKIDAYNTTNGTNIKKVPESHQIFGNKILNELNNELKKVMLSSGVYLGANIISTTLSILNNFNVDAIQRTVKNLPKFRLVELNRAETPILSQISAVNNAFYRPIASIDRYLEDVAKIYADALPANQRRFMQSAIPSTVIPQNVLEQAALTFVPFGRYPVASMREVMAAAEGRPLRTTALTQIAKQGEQINKDIQEQTPGINEVDPTKVIRQDEEGNLIQRSTVVTPIQAANLFMFGEYGDAIQIPILQFLNKLMSGSLDPNKIEINGKVYDIDSNFNIQTDKGPLNILPALSYVGRNMMSPVRFYNDVIVPLRSDKYIKDEKRLTNRLVTDAQYSNMGKYEKYKVRTNARERLGKRALGTYEYDWWENKPSRTIQRQIRSRLRTQQNIDRVLSND